MSEVKDQGSDHGFCTAYAVGAVVEAITGIKVSEAELMLRLKTKGGDDRTCDGSHLYLYPQIIREGVVLELNFPTTEDFKQYINIRKKMISDGQYDQSDLFGRNPDYKATIDEFIDWCKRSSRPIPTDLKPNWESEIYSPIAETNVLFRGFKFYSAAISGNTKQIINTRQVVCSNSYYCVKFIMKQVAVFEPNHPSGDPLHSLKFKLLERAPIAISIKTFAKYKLDADGRRVVEKTWLGTLPKLDNIYKIDVPPSEYELYGRHAVCLCGYDDAKGAFRFKNSWGPGWGDKGYAWLSYDYVKHHSKGKGVYVTKK